MEIPEDVLPLIKEFSMPLTRPDWRTLRKMPREKFINEFLKSMTKRSDKITDDPDYYDITTYMILFNASNYVKIMYSDLV